MYNTYICTYLHTYVRSTIRIACSWVCQIVGRIRTYIHIYIHCLRYLCVSQLAASTIQIVPLIKKNLLSDGTSSPSTSWSDGLVHPKVLAWSNTVSVMEGSRPSRVLILCSDSSPMCTYLACASKVFQCWRRDSGQLLHAWMWIELITS
jgi:hypothetical protein